VPSLSDWGSTQISVTLDDINDDSEYFTRYFLLERPSELEGKMFITQGFSVSGYDANSVLKKMTGNLLFFNPTTNPLQCLVGVEFHNITLSNIDSIKMVFSISYI
jgi:hypothetical protein